MVRTTRRTSSWCEGQEVPGYRVTVCIPSYNRLEWLMECLGSVRVAAEGLDVGIVVLDNASDEDYEPALANWVGPSLEYVRHPKNVGGAANVAAALEVIRRSPYGIVFHDDDLMSPTMIRREIQVLDDDPALVFAAAGIHCFRDRVDLVMPVREPMGCRRFKSAAELGSALLEGLPLHFGSVMYRTVHLAHVKLEPDKYGPVCDRPFLLDLARCGPCAVLSDSPALYRRHAAQDSLSTVLAETHWLALGEAFRRCMAANPSPSETRRYFRAATVYLLEVLEWTQRDDRRSAQCLIREARRRGLMGSVPLSLHGIENLLRARGYWWVTYLWHPVFLASRLGLRRPSWMRGSS